jgi:hypothetical protein
MAKRIQLRRDPAATWTGNNPVLADGEFGYEKDTKKFKIGDGVTEWNDLEYRTSATLEELQAILADLDPAPGDILQYRDGVWTKCTLQQLAEDLSQYFV